MRSVNVRKYFFSFENILLYLAVILFLLASFINLKIEKPHIELSKQETAINIDKNLLIFINAGNKRLFTDLLWVQTLIESDLERYAKKDLNNWLFLRFNTISTLDPKFYENYYYGGQFLAIVKDDLEGANVLYEKGTSIYPDDYQLNFNAGFLNYYEIGNYKKGLSYLKKIENHPKAPVYIKSIINKLLLESGTNIQSIYELVKHNLETTKDETLRKRLMKDLYAIKAEIDLDCLNKKQNNCSLYDLNGDRYLYRNGEFKAIQTFNKYRIKRFEDKK